MIYQHKNLAAGRWGELSLVEQMANIGSEVERAINWWAKSQPVNSQKAIDRALELIDLSLDTVHKKAQLKEIARVREALVDYFYGTNEFGSTDRGWRSYFLHFVYAGRKEK